MNIFIILIINNFVFVFIPTVGFSFTNNINIVNIKSNIILCPKNLCYSE